MEVTAMEAPCLPLSDDIWGRILLDAWGGEEVTYEVRRDDGHLKSFPISKGTIDEAIPPDAAEVLERARGRVLDLGCGPARHVVYLQERGLDVAGIDVSPGAAEVARARGGRDVRVMAIDEVDFAEASFDTCILMGSTIGAGCGIDGVARRLARLHPIVRSGGRVIAHVREPEATDKPEHRAYHEKLKQQGRYPGELRIRLEYQGYAEPWFDFALVNAAAVAEAAEQTGWQVAEILGDARSGYAVLSRP